MLITRIWEVFLLVRVTMHAQSPRMCIQWTTPFPEQKTPTKHAISLFSYLLFFFFLVYTPLSTMGKQERLFNTHAPRESLSSHARGRSYNGFQRVLLSTIVSLRCLGPELHVSLHIAYGATELTSHCRCVHTC
jgi:hypothetical protein